MTRFKRAGCLIWACWGCLVAVASDAASMSVNVLDRDHRGVGDVVVTVTPREAASAAASPAARTIMDQVARQFVPHVLVIRVGTEVAFPNSDTVAHQVYSFSPVKRFQLPLYRGQAHPPLLFDKPGVVVVGCNIHDDMLAYIFITSAPFFGKTDVAGKLVLEGLPAGDHEVVLWSPRFNEPQAALTRSVHVEEAQQLALSVRLTRALLPEPRPKPTKSGWDDY